MGQYKTRAELKQEAKDLMRGRWSQAILLNLVPTLLIIIGIILVSMVTAFVSYIGYMFFQQNTDWIIYSTNTSYDASTSTGGSILSVIYSLIIGLFSVGINYTFLDWLRNPNKTISPLKDATQVFSNKYFVPILLISIIMSIFIGLWALLFLIPGIIKAIAYSQTYFIYKDLNANTKRDDMGFTNYITESRQLMNGSKGRYFVLQLSFIGWHILAVLTFGIGYLWLNPYINATQAAFYKDLAKDKFLIIE